MIFKKHMQRFDLRKTRIINHKFLNKYTLPIRSLFLLKLQKINTHRKSIPPSVSDMLLMDNIKNQSKGLPKRQNPTSAQANNGT